MTVLPARKSEPIRIRIRAENPCQAAACEVPATGVIAYLSSGWRTVELRPVCTGHALALRSVGGCVVFPLKAVPPMETILAVVNAEIARRRQPPPSYAFAFNGGTTTGTATFTWQMS